MGWRYLLGGGAADSPGSAYPAAAHHDIRYASGGLVIAHQLRTADGSSTTELSYLTERHQQTPSLAEHVLFEVKRLIVG